MFKLIIEIMRTFPFVVIEAWYSASRYNTVLISVIKGTFTLVTFAPWGVHRQQWRSVAFPSSIFSNLDFTRVPRVSMCLPPPFLSAFCFFSSTEPSFRTDRKTPLSLIFQVPSTMTRYFSPLFYLIRSFVNRIDVFIERIVTVDRWSRSSQRSTVQIEQSNDLIFLQAGLCERFFLLFDRHCLTSRVSLLVAFYRTTK